MSIKYELVIYWSEEDQSFLVEVPELPGCMADGETYEHAVTNAKNVIGIKGDKGDATLCSRARFSPRPIPFSVS